jgi:hypothetical protein
VEWRERGRRKDGGGRREEEGRVPEQRGTDFLLQGKYFVFYIQGLSKRMRVFCVFYTRVE